VETSVVVVVAFVAYFAAVLGLGLYHRRDISTQEDFSVAGRKVSFWPLVGTVVGTNIGGGTLIAVTAGAFETGISAALPFLSAYGFVMVWALLFVRYVNRLRQYTLPDFFALRFGERVRVPAALFTMSRSVILTGMQILAMAGVMSVVLGWSLGLSMIVSVVVTVAYCLMGGMRSVIVTDGLQTILQTIGPIVLLAILLRQVGTDPLTQPTVRDTWNVASAGWGVFFGVVAASGPYYFIYQPMWQRAYAAKDERTAHRGMVVGTILSFLSLLLPVMIGVLARAVVPADVAPAQALPHLYLQQMPTWAGALFAVSLVGAIMSVLDSMVLDATANFVRDIYQKRMRVLDEGKLVRAGRICTVVVCALGLMMAFAVTDLSQLFVLGNGLATGGLFVVAVAAWLSRRATATGAFWAIVAGGVATVACAAASWVVHGDAAQGFYGFTPVYAAFVVGTAAIVLGSWRSGQSPGENPEATLFSGRHHQQAVEEDELGDRP
jgi:solute:Na+ symporter, SSS family